MYAPNIWYIYIWVYETNSLKKKTKWKNISNSLKKLVTVNSYTKWDKKALAKKKKKLRKAKFL